MAEAELSAAPQRRFDAALAFASAAVIACGVLALPEAREQAGRVLGVESRP